MLKLEFIDQRQTSFWIVDEVFSIGSSNKNQMVIARENILSTHATVYAQDGIVSIEPASPEGLISVNYVPISNHTVIRVGDVVSLAGTELRLIDPTVRQRRSMPDPVNIPVHPEDTPVQNVQTESNSSAKRVQPWKIKAIAGAHKDKLIDISDTLSIGRENSNDVVISGGHISRRHAELYVNNEQLIVRDLDSSNGTTVNGEAIKERAVFLGDEISFDSVVFRVAVGKAPNTLNESSMDKTQFRPALQFDDDLLNMTEPEFQPVVGMSATAKSELHAKDVSSVLNQVVKEPAVSQERILTENGSKPKANTYLIAFAILFVLSIISAGIAFL